MRFKLYYFIITWYLAKPHVPLVTVHGVVGPNVVHAGQEVEGVPVPLLWRLHSWPHHLHPSLRQPGLVGQHGVGEDGEGVYGRSLIVNQLNQFYYCNLINTLL